MATWEDVKNRLETELTDSASRLSDRKSLIVFARWSERRELSPDLFMTLSINALRTIVPTFRDLALDDRVDEIRELLVAAANLPITDLRIKMGKKRTLVPATEVGNVVVATFMKE